MVNRETYQSLAPRDAAVALRSYQRRYREALFAIAERAGVTSPDRDGGADIEDVAGRIGPDGRSPLELVTDSAQSISLLARSITSIIQSDAPVLMAAVIDRSARTWTGTTDSLTAALDSFAEDSAALADTAEHVSLDDWRREGRVAGGGEITALELLREAVATATTNLNELEATDW